MANIDEATLSSLKRKYESVDDEESIVEDVQPTVFPCCKCSATFVTKLSLSRHMILHEDDNDQLPEIIKSEESTIPSVSNFLETILKAPTTTTPKFQANGRPVPNLKPLPPLIPKKEFEMAQMKKFKCQMCSVFFGKKEDLARHVTRTHGGARFTCPYCRRNISRRDHLKRHIKNVHPEYCTDTEIGPFLADPNASRAAKEQHAENFVAQYVAGEQQSSSLTGTESGTNTDMLLSLAQDDQYNDDDLEEEGDDEFEGEEDLASSTEIQQITEPEFLPAVDNNEAYEDDSYDYMEQSLHLDGFQQVFQNQSLLGEGASSNFPTNTTGVIPPERKFKCDMCDAAFLTSINLQRHLNTHSIIRPHKCSICGKGFLRKEHLTKHLSSVHSGLRYECQFCGKDISRKDHLLRHIRNCHPVEFMGMPPDLIESEPQIATFQRPGASRSGNVLHRNSKLKLALLSCDLCSEIFNHVDELDEHQSSMHSDIRRFKCPHCPKAFKRKEHLVKHQVTHMPSNQKTFSCATCGKTFPRMDAVYDHFHRVHGDKSQQTTTSTLPCNLCEQMFQNRSQLSLHLQNYHGVSHADDGYFQNVQNHQFTANIPNYNNSFRKKKTSVKTKLHSMGIGAPISGEVSGSLGNLMGLINKGSLSLSRVMPSK